MGLGFPWAILSFLREENLINLIPKLIINTVYYIGLDLHKDSIAIAYTNSESRSEAPHSGEMEILETAGLKSELDDVRS